MEHSAEVSSFVSNPQQYLQELSKIDAIDEKYYNQWVGEYKEEQLNEANEPTNKADQLLNSLAISFKRCFDKTKLFHQFDENKVITENFASREKLARIIPLLDVKLFHVTEKQRQDLILLCGVSKDELLCKKIFNSLDKYDRFEFSLFRRMINNLGMEYDSEKIANNSSCPNISHNIVCILLLVKNSLKYYSLPELKELIKDLTHIAYDPICYHMGVLISSVLQEVLHLLLFKFNQSLQESEALLEIENAPLQFTLVFLTYISTPSLCDLSLMFAIRTIYSTINVTYIIKKKISIRSVYTAITAIEYLGSSLDKINLKDLICVCDIVNFIIANLDIPDKDTADRYISELLNVLEKIQPNYDSTNLKIYYMDSLFRIRNTCEKKIKSIEHQNPSISPTM